jgi:hypothetical protein
MIALQESHLSVRSFIAIFITVAVMTVKPALANGITPLMEALGQGYNINSTSPDSSNATGIHFKIVLAQMDPKMMQQLQGIMQDPNFQEKLADFTRDNNVDPEQLKAMMAQVKRKLAKTGRIDPRMMRRLQGIMQDPDFEGKLADFSRENNVDPDQLKAMIAQLKAKHGMAGLIDPRMMRQLQEIMQDPNFQEKLADFTRQNNVNPEQLNAMMARLKRNGNTGQLGPRPSSNTSSDISNQPRDH